MGYSSSGVLHTHSLLLKKVWCAKLVPSIYVPVMHPQVIWYCPNVSSNLNGAGGKREKDVGIIAMSGDT